MESISNIMSKIKNVVYPDKCILCRDLLYLQDDKWICEKCRSYIVYEDFSKSLLLKYSSKYSDSHNSSSEDEGYHIPQIGSIFSYDGIVRDSIRRWKYRGIRKYAKGYADLIINDLGLPIIFEIDGFIPVPVSHVRGKRRGFNQAYDLSVQMTNLSGIQTYDCLKRIKETKAQSKCTGKERRNNVKNTMQIKKEYNLPRLKNVAIVDDIYTTGSTARECIRTLTKEYNMKDTKFYIIVVGRGE